MDWPRLWWTLGSVLFILGLFALLLLGWRRRARRQGDIPAPAVAPAQLTADLAAPLEGTYVATTRSGAWQDRVVVHGLGRRAKATAHVTAEGVLVDRIGEDPIWLPADTLTLVATAPGIAGKVMGMSDGILVVSWRLGTRLLDSGFQAHNLDGQQDWIDAARSIITDAGAFHEETDTTAENTPADSVVAPTQTEQADDRPRTDGATS